MPSVGSAAKSGWRVAYPGSDGRVFVAGQGATGASPGVCFVIVA